MYNLKFVPYLYISNILNNYIPNEKILFSIRPISI